MPAAEISATAARLLPSVKITQGLFHNLLDGVRPDQFARQPEGVAANHPAFILGHLSLYPPKVLEALGVENPARPTAETAPLFEAGAECRDDPAGDIYPPMDQIVSDFDRVMVDAAERLATIPEDRFAGPIPPENSFSKIMPDLGALANFTLIAHPMLHAGQLSTWRRCMGLPPCKLM
jgi:hypothetical protein